MTIRKVARISSKPGQEGALKEALQILEAETRNEPGCIEFAFFQAISDPTSFVLLEQFADQIALDTHMQLPHTQTFFKAQVVAAVRAVDVASL
jgi:quinol monooxygenase YgiN